MERYYTAFISYRHCPTDIAVAEKLHKLLERYSVPKDLRTERRKGLGIIFRDRDELPLSNNLTGDIYQALEHSQFLIVICTPDTPKSLWVDREIEYFINRHGRDRILVVLAGGTPEESIPKRITTMYAEDGETVLEQLEPLCAYLVASTRRKILSNLKKELPRLAAALLDCPYDSLIQRQKRYAMKKGLAISGVTAGAVLCAALGFILMLTDKNAQIRAQLHQSQLNESEALSLISAQLLAEGDRMGALEKALTALPSAEQERPYCAAAEHALANALHVYRDEGVHFDRKITQGDHIRAFALSADGCHAVTVDTNGYLRCFDVATQKELWNYGIEYYYYYGYGHNEDRLLFLENQYVVLTFLSEIQVHSLLTGEVLYSAPYEPANGIDLEGTHYADEELMSFHTTYVDYWYTVEYQPTDGTFSYDTGTQSENLYLALQFQLPSGSEITCMIPAADRDSVLFLQHNRREDAQQVNLPLTALVDTVNAFYVFPSGDRFLRLSYWRTENQHDYTYICSVYDAATLEHIASIHFTSYELFSPSWTFSPDETRLFQKGAVLDLEKHLLTKAETEPDDHLYYLSDTAMPSRTATGAPVYTAHYDPASDILSWTENGQNLQVRESPYDLVQSEGWMHPWNLVEISGNGLILMRNYNGNFSFESTDADYDRLRPTEYIIYSVKDDSWQRLENPCTANGIPALTFGLEHPWIAFADFDGMLRIYDQASASMVYEWDVEISASAVSHMRFLCEDTLLLIRLRNNQLYIIDTAGGTILGNYSLADFSDTGEFNCTIATSGENGGQILYISDVTAQGTGLRIDMSSWTVVAEISRMACYLPTPETFVCGTSYYTKALRVLPVCSLDELLEKGRALIQ